MDEATKESMQLVIDGIAPQDRFEVSSHLPPVDTLVIVEPKIEEGPQDLLRLDHPAADERPSDTVLCYLLFIVGDGRQDGPE